jgi:hypothetical protein
MIKGADPPEGGKLQMQKSKSLFRMGVAAILILSIFLCSFMNGMVQQSSIPGKQIPTVPPIVATLPTPIGGQTPVATPIPTLGPGQYFEEGDEDDLPEVARPDLLRKEDMGYSAILGEEGLFLVWSTDDDGNKHYYILDQEKDYLYRIQNIIDDNLIARRELDATSPLFSLIWAGTKTVIGEVGVFICGGATIATVELPPVAGVFGTCTVGSLTLFGTSLNKYLEVSQSIRAYERRTEQDRLAIEGIFREINADPNL